MTKSPARGSKRTGRPPVLQPKIIDAIRRRHGNGGAVMREIVKAVGGSRRSVIATVCRMASQGWLDYTGPDRHRVYTVSRLTTEALKADARRAAQVAAVQARQEAAEHAKALAQQQPAPLLERARSTRFNPDQARKLGRAGWGAGDPMHITADTAITICPPMPQPTRTNTHANF
jgi:hypothetical protein